MDDHVLPGFRNLQYRCIQGKLMRLALFFLAVFACAQTSVTLGGNSYTLMEGPVGLLDGPCAMGAYSASTDYHDLEAVSYSGTWYRALKQNGPATTVKT